MHCPPLQAPNYLKFVEDPIDFGEIRSCLSKNMAGNICYDVVDVLMDVALIFKNCAAYNEVSVTIDTACGLQCTFSNKGLVYMMIWASNSCRPTLK